MIPPVGAETVSGSVNDPTVVISMVNPGQPRPTAMWQAGDRIADYRRLFAFYLDIVEQTDFALQKDAQAHDRMMRDGQVFSTIRIRQMATASRNLQISPHDHEDGEAVFYSDMVNHMWDLIPRRHDLLLKILDAIPRGISFQEIVWDMKDDLIFWPTSVWPVHPSRLRFDRHNRPTLISPVDVFFGERLPPYSWILHTSDPEPGDWSKPEEEGRLMFGRSMLDRLYPWFLWKSICMRNWLRSSERAANGALLGRYPSRNPEARSAVQEALKLLQTHGFVLWPSDAGFDVELMKSDVGVGKTFIEMVNYIDDQIAKMVLGTPMLSEGSGQGSYAMAEVQERSSFSRLAAFDSKALLDTLRSQFVYNIFKMNDWDWSKAPVLTLSSGPRWSLTEVVAAVDRLVRLGYPVSYEVVTEETGIREPGPHETILKLNPITATHKIESGPGGLVESTEVSSPAELPIIAGEKAGGKTKVAFLDADAFAQGPGVDEIRRAAKALEMVTLTYRDGSGKTETYLLEPYSFRRTDTGKTMLFAHDVRAGHTKSFLLDRIVSATSLSGITFDPKYAVEIKNVA